MNLFDKSLDQSVARQLKERLRAGDPAEPQTTLEVAAMRRRILDSARVRGVRTALWPRLALIGALLVAFAVLLAKPEWRSGLTADPSTGVTETHVAPGPGVGRQVQFQTPGGTRVIWVVVSNLDL